MAFIRYKQRGNKWYVYEVSNLWNKETKKYYQETTYLGVALEKGGEYTKAQKRAALKPEKAIVDFGDGFAIAQIIGSSGLGQVINSSFPEGAADTIKTLIAYQLSEGSAMRNCADWAEGNAISKFFPKSNLTSQAISRTINQIGDEKVMRTFFANYIAKFFNKKCGILIDSTAMPSSINSSLNSWGYGAGGIQEKINCLMLVDKDSKLPIYYRALAGDIADVSTLQLTVDEVYRLGIEMDQAIFDAGYFSESNIKYLAEKKINFISRMPKSRNSFKELLANISEIEKLENAVIYGERALFIESKQIELYGYKMFAHVILDQSKRSSEVKKILLDKRANPTEKKDHETMIKNAGYFVLISAELIEKNEIMPNYYLRQQIEQIFGFAKNNNSLLPLRVHSEQSINGYLMLVFLSLILFVIIKEKLGITWTVEQALNILRCHKAKIYQNEMVPIEARKKDKDIYQALSITVPSSLGV